MTLPPFLAAIPIPILVAVPIVGLLVAVGVYEYEKNKKPAPLPITTARPAPAPAPTGATGPVNPGNVVAAATPVTLTSAMLANNGMTGDPATVSSAALALVAAMAAQPSPPGNTAALTAFQASIGLAQTGWYDSPTAVHLSDVLQSMGMWTSSINQLPNESWPNKPTGTPFKGRLVLMPIKMQGPPAPSPATTGFGPQILAAAQQALSSLGPAPSSSDFGGSIIYQVVTASLNQLASNPTVAQLDTAMTNIQGTNGANLQQSSQAQAAYNILNRVNQTVSA